MRAHLKDAYESFYSAPLYRRVANEWNGLGFRFLMALAAVMTAYTMLSHMAWLRPVVGQLPYIAGQMPTAAYGNGRIAVAPQVPYFIYLDQTNPHFLAIDTRYSEYGLEALADWMHQHHVVATLTATRLVLPRSPEAKVQSYPLTPLMLIGGMTQSGWQKFFHAVRGWEWTIMTVVTFSVHYVLLVLSALLWGVLTQFLSQFFGAFINMGASIRLAAVTSLPFWLITELLAGLGDEGLFTRLSTRLGYLYLAIRANK